MSPARAEVALPRELRDEVEQFLYREARLLDEEREREWLDEMVDRDIRYQVFIRQLRYKRDEKRSGPRQVYAYDDDWAGLDARVKVLESVQVWVHDPVSRQRHLVTNVEAYVGAHENEYAVYSNCHVARNRAVYEEMHHIYGRRDILRRDAVGHLRLLRRVIDYDQRFVRGKNLLFIL